MGHPALPPFSTVDEGLLELEDISEEDEGQYRCIGTTTMNYATDDSSVRLAVDEPSRNFSF